MTTALAAQQRGVGFDLRQITPTSPITIDCGGGHITMSVQNVINWIAPEAPLQDAMRFLMVCRATGLNPLLGEILLLRMGKSDSKFQVVVPKSGLLKSAQKSPDYLGHESGITCWDGSEFRDIEGMVRPPVQGVLVVGGWAKVYRRGLTVPIYKRVSLDEYRKQTYIWDGIPLTMICKVALAAALREAFNLGESYDDAEVPYDVSDDRPVVARHVPDEQPQAAVQPALDPPVNPPADPAATFDPTALTTYRTADSVGFVKPELVETIDNLCNEVGMDDDAYGAMLIKRNVTEAGDLTVAQAEEIVAKLQSVIRDRQATEVFGAKAESVVLPEVVRPEASHPTSAA